jgi:decaprenylphospho-beta-D-ribofuranose 2-oxidase
MTDRPTMLTGWGRTSPTLATVRPIASVEALVRGVRGSGPRGVVARGLGRSYGDIAQNAGGTVLDLTPLRGVEHLDPVRGTVTALAGTSFDALLRAVVPHGWFLPVTPGTRSVTLGGAIANDVHGKNHHRDGSLGHHVTSLDLLGADGEVRTVARDGSVDVFDATVGGLGLTGVVVRATLRLVPIETSMVRVDTERASDLDDLMARMHAGDAAYRYSVAWLDTLAHGRSLGRGILTRGDHATRSELRERRRSDPLAYDPRSVAAPPVAIPMLSSRAVVRAFNEAWFRRAPIERRDELVAIAPFFHPLDAVDGWNVLYGPRGVIQYQFAVPFGAERVVRTILERFVARGVVSFLVVLKRFGPGRGLLSFPIEGWTLAIDVPAGQDGLHALLRQADEDVATAGGRIYLAKDSRVARPMVDAMYPELERWAEIRDGLDPMGIWRSDLARRLGLVEHDRARSEVAR